MHTQPFSRSPVLFEHNSRLEPSTDMTEKYSKYELVSPDWLNESFFVNVLRESEKDKSIKVNSLKITPGSSANDHYGSVMYRAKLEYTNSKRNKSRISLIVKTMPEMDSIKKDLLGDSFVFKTEIRMYSETIPKMEAILRKYGDDTVLGAKAIYFAMEPHQIIIFEDLVEKGFSTLKGRMPTEEEVRRAMLKIAKWHAVSYKLAQEEPESVNTYNEGTFNMDLTKLDFFTNGIKVFIDKILMCDEELKGYIPYFKELDKTILQSCVEMWNAFKKGHKALFVLNHGDFHFKNMMFRHKPNGQFDDLMLLDFQTCYFGAATSDLVYSMYMLCDNDLRWNKRDELIYYYFSNFIQTLKTIEFKGEFPKMVDLQMEFLRYRWLETFIVATFLPILSALTDESIDLDKTVESDEERHKLYSNPALVKEVKRILPRLLQKGYLD